MLGVLTGCLCVICLFPPEPLRICLEGQELLQTSYEPTEPMSTYVLALAVCDFGFRSTRLADDTLARTTRAPNPHPQL